MAGKHPEFLGESQVHDSESTAFRRAAPGTWSGARAALKRRNHLRTATAWSC